MLFLLLSFSVMMIGGSIAFILGTKEVACKVGAWSSILGCTLAFYPTLLVLLGFKSSITFAASAYTIPVGELLFNLDPLASIFLLPTLIVSSLCAFYGMSYLSRGVAVKKNYGSHWFFYNLLIIGLILTYTAADAFMFMVSWEIMSVAPFFLIIFNDEDESVRKGASSYLIAAHLGALFLLVFFVLLSSANNGALDFDTFIVNSKGLAPASTLFIFALIGFGTKSGLMPVHVWLPEAHPAAPAHISAIMSGVMINTGLYGMLRVFTFLGASATWWSFTLIGVGGVSAILGIFFAMSSHSIKRTLAYSSIENMGIVCMAFGFSLYAIQCDKFTISLLFALGGMIHLLNHSFYKSLLFLVAGGVAKGTGTDIMDHLGGLQKRAPILGFTFFVGALAICALPPLNGFAGKLILYVAMAIGGASTPVTGFLFWGGILILAVASGFSLLCFTKIYGIAFLGNPRSKAVEKMEPLPLIERYTLLTMVGICLVSALLIPVTMNIFANSLGPYLHVLSQLIASADINNDVASLGVISSNVILPSGTLLGAEHTNGVMITISDLRNILVYINIGFLIFLALTLVIYICRKRVMRRRTVITSGTWDCGYANPTPRIQYTGSSFSQPAVYLMSFLIRPKAIVANLVSNFPSSGKAELTTDDWIRTSIYKRLFLACAYVALKAKKLQHGRANTYILYIFVTLVTLLAWKIK